MQPRGLDRPPLEQEALEGPRHELGRKNHVAFNAKELCRIDGRMDAKEERAA